MGIILNTQSLMKTEHSLDVDLLLVREAEISFFDHKFD